MSSRQLGGSHKKNLPPGHLLLFICSHEQRFAIIAGTNHTVQNCKGEFIIKEINKHQMTMISKKTITNTIIIHKYSSLQHTLNN